MPEIIFDGKIPCSTGKDWRIEFDAPKKGLFTLNLNKDDLVLTSRYANICGLGEGSALFSKRKAHRSEDGEEAGLDSSGTIPFGSEPSVARNYSLQDGLLSATVDFSIRGNQKLEHINAGGFQIGGSISKVALIDRTLSKPEWKSPAEMAEYHADCPPLSLLVQSEAGTVLEFSLGNDIWRWVNAARMEGTSDYSIRFSENSVEMDWNLYDWRPRPEMEPPQGRAWRLNYVIAWTLPGSKVKRMVKPVAFDYEKLELPEACLSTESKAVCACSKGGINALKKLVRGSLQSGARIVLENVEPHLCNNASHQDRAKLKNLIHWDLYALLEFRRWAERQMAQSGGKFSFRVKKDSVFADLPSLKR